MNEIFFIFPSVRHRRGRSSVAETHETREIHSCLQRGLSTNNRILAKPVPALQKKPFFLNSFALSGVNNWELDILRADRVGI